MLARRKGWQRVIGNSGKAVVLVDESEPPPDSPPERPAEQAEQRPDELAEARERITRLEGEAAGHADRVQDLHNALADLAGRLDRATAELTEARRSWLERVLAALRR